MKGLSPTNLHYCRKFYNFYNSKNQILPQVEVKLQLIDNKDDTFLPQLGVKIHNGLLLIPWGHNKSIIDKCLSLNEAFFYINKTIENNWSRAILEIQIETNLYERQDNNANNFSLTMPTPESDLANEIVKDEYNLRFLNISNEIKELELEKALVLHMTQFLTELGKGFAYMGRQFPIKVGSKEFKIDLLFYHTKLKCYIVIELKVREFDPDFTGKLVFYTTAVDKLIKDKTDNPTIGILLCKDKDDVVVDYALTNIKSPLGVGKMQFSELTDEIKAVLPTVKELKEEMLKIK